MSTLATALPRPARPRTLVERLRWALADSWTVTRRDILHWVRSPSAILMGPAFGVLSVLLFGYVFGSAMSVHGGGNYREFLLPGMLGQTMVFGVAITMSAVAEDAARGVTDRFRSVPMARAGVVAGRSLADMLYSTVELSLLVACGLAIGWRWHDGVLPALAAVGLLLLLRFSLLWLGIYLGLMVTPEGAATAFGPLYPLTMLSSAFVSPEQMPSWLGTVAEWNPVSSTIAATRELFGNPGTGGGWAAEHAVLLAVAWPLLIVAIFLPLSVRRYQALSR